MASELPTPRSSSSLALVAKRLLVYAVLLGAGLLALKLVVGAIVGAVVAIGTIALVVALVVAVIWALRRL